MQPYFLPGLGYFDLIARSDQWVVFDTAQYRKRSWMNRNRVLHPSAGWQYITAHTGHVALGTPIFDVPLSADPGWRSHLLGQLQHYRKRAPFYRDVTDLLRAGLEAETENLARLNVTLLRLICDYLGISFRYDYFSEMQLNCGPVRGPGDWALRICESLRATEYINPPGGASLFDPEAFRASGIRLRIQKFEELSYSPPGYDYIEGLSVVDVLMWCPPSVVAGHLAEQRRLAEGSVYG